MKEMQTSPDQITVFYNPEDSTHVKTVAHAKGTGKQVLEVPFREAPSAYNVWTKIWDGLGPGNRDIFDPNDERYKDLIEGREFSFEDWHNIALHNPDLIRYPIAISGDKVIAISRPSEIYRLQELGPEQAEPNIAPENRAHNDADEFGAKLPG